MEKSKAIAKLEKCLRLLQDLTAIGADDPYFQKWCRDAEILLQHIFGSKTRHISDFRTIEFTPSMYSMSNPGPAFRKVYSNGRESMKALLLSMIDEVQDYGLGNGAGNVSQIEGHPASSNKVFVVHGHNNEIRESVARLITQLDHEPIVLHEQPNKGRTIIEKFVDYSDVGFAVVILTGDDCGGPKDKSPDEYKPRARQNVILELGFFLGKLGRDRVCALYQKGVEIPSDYDGVVFISLDDAGAWRYKLGKEMEACGLEVDIRKIK